MSNKLADELPTIAASDVDQNSDVAVVHDASAGMLKQLSVKDLLNSNVSEGSGAGLFPLAATSSDVTAAPTLSSDTYSAIITRWDAAFTSGETQNGLTVTKTAMSPTTVDGNTLYYYKFEPARPTHSVIVVANLHGDEREGGAALLEVAKLYWNNATVANAFNQIRADTTLYFVPCVNPDGYDDDQRLNNNAVQGVDLNRNWDSSGYWSSAWENWSTGGSEYKGASAHSENETQALKTLIDDTADLSGVLDVHTYGLSIDVDCGLIWPASNEPTEQGDFIWAAKAAFGSSVKIDAASRTTEPPPWLINYVAGLEKWGLIVELGQANVDVETAAGMAEAANWLGNTIIAMARLPNQVYRNTTGPRAYYITEGQSLNLQTDTDYIDLVNYTATTGTFTTDSATDDKLDDTGHGLSDGTPLQLTTSDTLPAGLALRTTYWVINSTANDFEVSSTGPNGTAVDITDDGTGTHTWTQVVDYGFWIPVDFQGIALGDWSFQMFPGSDAGDQLYFQPYFGQNIGVFSREDSTLQLGEERYVNGGTSKRASVSISAMRLVFPSSRETTDISNIDLAFRCRYKNLNAPTGTPVLYRFAARLLLIPFSAGDNVELWTLGTSTQTQRF